MIRAVVSILALAVGLTALALLSGYVDYRRSMNACIDSGGVVIKTTQGLKCVPTGKVIHI